MVVAYAASLYLSMVSSVLSTTANNSLVDACPNIYSDGISVLFVQVGGVGATPCFPLGTDGFLGK